MKSLKYIIPVLLFLSLVLITLFTKKSENPIDDKIRVVQSHYLPDKLKTSNEIWNHNQIIISTLQERESSGQSSYDVRETNMIQLRTIFIAILAVILSFLFNEKTNKKALVKILITMILIFYFAEVHTRDLLNRSKGCNTIVTKSLEQIANSNSLELDWYTFDYVQYRAQQVKAASLNRWYRKAWDALHPDVEQFVFYILPFLFLLGYHFNLTEKMKITKKEEN